MNMSWNMAPAGRDVKDGMVWKVFFRASGGSAQALFFNLS
jgi:hypothetical protein